jgi:hypothetical protein
MLYLPIGRRFYAAGILILASAIGILILLSWFAFDLRDVRAAALLPNWEGLQFTSKRLSPFLSVPGAMLAVVGFLACALVFLLWRRTRYFGTFAPLVVAILLAWWPGGFVPGASELWAVPFAFLFIGGIYADLLDDRFFAGRFKKLVRVTLLVLVGANLLLSLRMLAGA